MKKIITFFVLTLSGFGLNAQTLPLYLTRANTATVTGKAIDAGQLTSGSIPTGRYASNTIPFAGLTISGGTSSNYVHGDGTVGTPSGAGPTHDVSVSYPLASDGSGGFTSSAAALPFAYVPFNTVVSDAESLWDSTNKWYTVPEDGNYLVITKMRPADGDSTFSPFPGTGNSYGQGPYTSSADNIDFIWYITNGRRNGSVNVTLMAGLHTGDHIRMYYYTEASYRCGAAMQIFLKR